MPGQRPWAGCGPIHNRTPHKKRPPQRCFRSRVQLDLGVETILASVTLFRPTLGDKESAPVSYGGGDFLVVRMSYTPVNATSPYNGCAQQGHSRGAGPGGVCGVLMGDPGHPSRWPCVPRPC